MARYKPYDLKQDKLIPLSFADQVIPGSFEHTLNEIVALFCDVLLYCDELAVHSGQPLRS